jgi:hypothetical protein
MGARTALKEGQMTRIERESSGPGAADERGYPHYDHEATRDHTQL